MSAPSMRLRTAFLCCGLVLCSSGCSVIAVADAAVTVGATAVKAGAVAVGAAIDVAGAGVRMATREEKKEEE